MESSFSIFELVALGSGLNLCGASSWILYRVHTKIQRPYLFPLALRFWLLWPVWACLQSSIWWSIWLWRRIVYPGFIHCYMLLKQFLAALCIVDAFMFFSTGCSRVQYHHRSLWVCGVSLVLRHFVPGSITEVYSFLHIMKFLVISKHFLILRRHVLRQVLIWCVSIH